MNKKEFQKLSEKEQRAYLIAHRPNLDPPKRRGKNQIGTRHQGS